MSILQRVIPIVGFYRRPKSDQIILATPFETKLVTPQDGNVKIEQAIGAFHYRFHSVSLNMGFKLSVGKDRKAIEGTDVDEPIPILRGTKEHLEEVRQCLLNIKPGESILIRQSESIKVHNSVIVHLEKIYADEVADTQVIMRDAPEMTSIVEITKIIRGWFLEKETTTERVAAESYEYTP